MTVPAGIIVNAATGRFHPVYFRRSPLPSEGAWDESAVQRHKSGGHHTEGFATEAEALEMIGSENWTDTGMRWNWDGEGVPSLICWA